MKQQIINTITLAVAILIVFAVIPYGIKQADQKLYEIYGRCGDSPTKYRADIIGKHN